MTVLLEKFTPAAKAHHDAAIKIAQWSRRFPTMADLAPEDLAALPHSVLAFDDQEHDLLGHVGVRQEENGLWVVGHVTNPERRREGIARKVLLHLLETVPKYVDDITVLKAHVNDQSLPLYVSSGVGGIKDEPRDDDPLGTGCVYTVDLMPALEKHGQQTAEGYLESFSLIH